MPIVIFFLCVLSALELHKVAAKGAYTHSSFCSFLAPPFFFYKESERE